MVVVWPYSGFLTLEAYPVRHAHWQYISRMSSYTPLTHPGLRIQNDDQYWYVVRACLYLFSADGDHFELVHLKPTSLKTFIPPFRIGNPSCVSGVLKWPDLYWMGAYQHLHLQVWQCPSIVSNLMAFGWRSTYQSRSVIVCQALMNISVGGGVLPQFTYQVICTSAVLLTHCVCTPVQRWPEKHSRSWLHPKYCCWTREATICSTPVFTTWLGATRPFLMRSIVWSRCRIVKEM